MIKMRLQDITALITELQQNLINCDQEKSSISISQGLKRVSKPGDAYEKFEPTKGREYHIILNGGAQRE